MADTGAERLTDTFRYKHHTMPVLTITPTDRIIAATRHLTNALSGTQEAPPDKLQAILSLRQLLLGEAPPPVPVVGALTTSGKDALGNNIGPIVGGVSVGAVLLLMAGLTTLAWKRRRARDERLLAVGTTMPIPLHSAM